MSREQKGKPDSSSAEQVKRSQSPKRDSGAIFSCTVKARFGDEDHAQIVYFPRIFHYFQCCLEDFFEMEGVPLRTMISELQVGIPLVRVEGRFHSPIRAGNLLRMRMRVSRVGSKSFGMKVQGYLLSGAECNAPGPDEDTAPRRVSGTLPNLPKDAIHAVTGELHCCAVALKSMKSIELPTNLRDCLAPYLQQEDESNTIHTAKSL